MWQKEISHSGLRKYRVVRGRDAQEVEQKAWAQMAVWDDMWERKQGAENKRAEREQVAVEREEKKEIAQTRTEEAQAALMGLERLLDQTLGVQDRIDWETLKRTGVFAKAPPLPVTKPELPRRPEQGDLRYRVRSSFWDILFSSRLMKRKSEATRRYQSDLRSWQQQVDSIKEATRGELETYHRDLKQWESERADFASRHQEHNEAIDRRRDEYLTGTPAAIHDYCDMVLTRSEYPDEFPQECEIDYSAETRVLLVDYSLPPPDVLPRVREVRYVQARDAFVESTLTDGQFNKMYDSVVYQICLRTLHELFEADTISALDSIVFNGWVRSVDKATGKEANACIMSLHVKRDEFLSVNLAQVDPKACFKKLKGVGSSALHSLTPVAPILQMDRDDKRFVSSYQVAADLDDGYNLAAMDWEDFEHLIRELFEEEFSQAGGEVKVTRASRDGGVDAVVFDPDPIHGGKTVIQAKRYTNTVGVSAVRDLYGTVLNEGAMKGILVTTSDYGPDAYQFAQDKPLVLLNGSNLLHLLSKHGHKARIDLKQAKQILAEKEKEERQQAGN